MKRDSDCLAIINLFRKIIASLACIINMSNNNDIVMEANKYISDFINQYSQYLIKTSKKDIIFMYSEDDIVDFSYRCIEEKNDNLILIAEDLQFGIIDLMKLIK